MYFLGRASIASIVSSSLVGAWTQDVLCEIVEDIAFLVPGVNNSGINVSSAKECCNACRKSGLDAWTFDPRKEHHNCVLMQNTLLGDRTLRTEHKAGVFSGFNGMCNAHSGMQVCVVGNRSVCCDGAGATIGLGRCYDPTKGSCCQNDLEGILCPATASCCTYHGECFQPVCCSTTMPFCVNTTKTGAPSSPQCSGKAPDPVPPSEPFPLKFHTWMVTSVVSGGPSEPSGHLTYNFGQLVTYSFNYDEKKAVQEQWSCRPSAKLATSHH